MFNRELLKKIPGFRFFYCWYRIHYYRWLQQKHFKRPLLSTSNHKSTWDSNLEVESDWWEGVLEQPEFLDRLKPDYLRNRELGAVLDHFLNRPSIKAIDVGCGPFPTVPTVYKGLTIERTLIDPLASNYNKLRKQLPGNQAEIMEGNAEELDKFFAAGTFDLTYMCNALDHAYDPMEIVRQMGRLLAGGGALYLEHFENEAEKENHHGLHQWNLFERCGDMIIADRNNEYSLQEILGPTFQVEAKAIYRHGGFVIAIAWKKGTAKVASN